MQVDFDQNGFIDYVATKKIMTKTFTIKLSTPLTAVMNKNAHVTQAPTAYGNLAVALTGSAVSEIKITTSDGVLNRDTFNTAADLVIKSGSSSITVLQSHLSGATSVTHAAESSLYLNKPPSTPKYTEDTTVFDEGLGSMNRRSEAHSLWDFDNDGDFDLLVLGNDWKPFWYWENTGTKYKAVWTQREDAETNPFLLMNMPTASGASGRKSKYFVVYDLDADGDGDVIVSSQVGKFFYIFIKQHNEKYDFTLLTMSLSLFFLFFYSQVFFILKILAQKKKQ